MAAVDDQLKRLQTDYIDVYQVHRLDPHTPIEETMYSLDQIVRSGKVRYIGGSTMPAYKFAQMVMIADWKGYARPIAMQNLYNLVQREEEREMNRLCHEQGVGLIPYSPLARGFLAGNRSKEGGGETERSKNDAQVQAGTYRDCDWEIVDRLKKVAAGKNASPAQAALAWLLSKPYMGCAHHRRHQPRPAHLGGAGDRDHADGGRGEAARGALSVPRVAGRTEPYAPPDSAARTRRRAAAGRSPLPRTPAARPSGRRWARRSARRSPGRRTGRARTAPWPAPRASGAICVPCVCSVLWNM